MILLPLTDKNDGTTTWFDAERVVVISQEPARPHRPLSPGRPAPVDPPFTYVVLDSGQELMVREDPTQVIELMQGAGVLE